MHYGAEAFTFEMARQLRKRMTKAEIILWEELRQNKLGGLKFRRQHPISRFIADFYCHKLQLVIELDGGIHNNIEVRENDEIRQKEIESFGITIIRFSNDEVLHNINDVLSKIESLTTGSSNK